MAEEVYSRANPKWMTWVGWILGVLPCCLLVMSAAFKLIQSEQVIEGFEAQNWPVYTAVPIGVVELASTVIYLIPQTAVLGAILLVGYLVEPRPCTFGSKNRFGSRWRWESCFG